MSAAAHPRDNKIHMHIENVTTYHKHVQVTPEWYEEAARRYPQLVDRIHTTIGWDYQTFAEEMKTAEILVFMGIDFVSKDFAKRAPNLRWIQLTSAGAEHIMPFDWLPRNVIVTN